MKWLIVAVLLSPVSVQGLLWGDTSGEHGYQITYNDLLWGDLGSLNGWDGNLTYELSFNHDWDTHPLLTTGSPSVYALFNLTKDGQRIGSCPQFRFLEFTFDRTSDISPSGWYGCAEGDVFERHGSVPVELQSRKVIWTMNRTVSEIEGLCLDVNFHGNHGRAELMIGEGEIRQPVSDWPYRDRGPDEGYGDYYQDGIPACYTWNCGCTVASLGTGSIGKEPEIPVLKMQGGEYFEMRLKGDNDSALFQIEWDYRQHAEIRIDWDHVLGNATVLIENWGEELTFKQGESGHVYSERYGPWTITIEAKNFTGEVGIEIGEMGLVQEPIGGEPITFEAALRGEFNPPRDPAYEVLSYNLPSSAALFIVALALAFWLKRQ